MYVSRALHTGCLVTSTCTSLELKLDFSLQSSHRSPSITAVWLSGQQEGTRFFDFVVWMAYGVVQLLELQGVTLKLEFGEGSLQWH
jgi:hypothetical protein